MLDHVSIGVLVSDETIANGLRWFVPSSRRRSRACNTQGFIQTPVPVSELYTNEFIK